MVGHKNVRFCVMYVVMFVKNGHVTWPRHFGDFKNTSVAWSVIMYIVGDSPKKGQGMVRPYMTTHMTMLLLRRGLSKFQITFLWNKKLWSNAIFNFCAT